MKRRLAAILAADVAGYSALMQADEMGTIRLVRGHIAAFEPQIALHGGRIVKTMGDGFLAEFASVLEAVACAQELQKTAQDRNAAVPESRRAVFRMGIHSGDVLEEDGDVYGDDVNIAARIEQIANPGTVAVSARIHDEINGRLDLSFQSLGTRMLKGIAQGIEIYELASDAAPRVADPVPDLPVKPSIAVLPLQIFSNDPEDEFLADGIGEDLTTGLSAIPWLFVIARNSAFTYKGLSVDSRQIGRELGVRYIVEGSLRRAGPRVRISSRLVDATDGRQVWANRFDGVIDDVFDLQDRVALEIAQTVAPEIQSEEMRKSVRKRPGDMTVYDMYLRALGCINTAKVGDAEDLLQQAIGIDPDYATAKAVLSWCATLHIAWQSNDRFSEMQARGLDLAHQALDSLRRDLETEAYAGYALAFFLDDIERGRSLLANVTERCPSFAWAWASRSFLEAFFGVAEDGIAYGKTALRLNPRDPLIFRTHLALANSYVGARDFEAALDAARTGLSVSPCISGFRVVEIIALTELGRKQEAVKAAMAMTARHPTFNVVSFQRHTGKFRNLAPYGHHLTDAGLPQ